MGNKEPLACIQLQFGLHWIGPSRTPSFAQDLILGTLEFNSDTASLTQILLD